MSLDRRGSGSGSFAARYAARSHREQEEAQAAIERGEAPPQESHYPVRLPTHAGVAHVPHNLTDGIVVDPMDKKRTRFENEKYLRAHPELGLLLNDFIQHVLERRPAEEDIQATAVEFFVREGDRRHQSEQQQQQAASSRRES